MPPLATSTLRIGVHVEPRDPFWVQVREAVHHAAHRRTVDLVPLDGDPTLLSGGECEEAVAELGAQELDAVVALYLPEALTHRILDAGIPVVHLSETGIARPRFVSPEGLYASARVAGAYLAERLAGRGDVLIVGGLCDVGDNGRSRLAGVRHATRPYPRLRLHHVPTPWDPAQARPPIEAALQARATPPDAIFGLSDSLALAARDAGRTLGLIDDRTAVAGINGDPLALAAIADDGMAATVDTPADDFGAQAVELAVRAALGNDVPRHFGYQPRLVTKQNVAEVATRKLIAIADLPSRLVGVNRQREQQRLAQLETSQAIHGRVGTLLDRRRLLATITDLIRANYRYAAVRLWHWHEQEREVELDQADGTGRRLPIAEDRMLAEALGSERPIFVPDTRHSARFPTGGVIPGGSRVVAPIRCAGTVLGFLDLASDRVLQLSRQDLAGLQMVVDQLGVALWNAELYEAALAAQAKAERADRLKTQLLANVSHELRTPLNVVLGYTEGALATPNAYGVELPPSLRRDLGHVYRSGEHLLRLINDLLDISRADIGELDLFPEPIATTPFLRETFQGLAEGVGPAGDVVWELAVPDRLPILQADPLRLRQILLNVLQNARNYTRRGRIVLGAEACPAWLHLWVSDTGSGIPPELQELVFEPFVRGDHAERPVDGIGLGLSITRRLVSLHRGRLTVDSRPGAGTTFHVYLPWPGLDGRPAVADDPAGTEPILLLLGTRDGVPDAIASLADRQGLSVLRLAADDDLASQLAGRRPAAIAIDLDAVDLAEWRALDRPRHLPALRCLPLIVFGHPAGDDPPALGLAAVVPKPLGERTVVDLLRALPTSPGAGPVLIVDDAAEARELYRRLAAAALPGRAVALADGGAAALTLIEREPPCLVILDLAMPDVDGFAVLERLRAAPRTCHVPVLVVTGRALSDDDLRRLDHRRVTLQSKGILTAEEAVAAIRQATAAAETLPQPTGMLAKRAAAYLQQHHARALTRQEVAAALGVHRDYLSRIFHQELGVSPWEYLNRYRVGRAKELLRATDLPITEVAARVGFDDSAYFSRVFRREVGQSPRGYRQGGP